MQLFKAGRAILRVGGWLNSNGYGCRLVHPLSACGLYKSLVMDGYNPVSISVSLLG